MRRRAGGQVTRAEEVEERVSEHEEGEAAEEAQSDPQTADEGALHEDAREDAPFEEEEDEGLEDEEDDEELDEEDEEDEGFEEDDEDDEDDEDAPYVARLSAPELFHAGEVAHAGAGVLDSQESLAHVPDPNLAASLEMYSAMKSEEEEAPSAPAPASAREASSEGAAPATSPATGAVSPAPIYGQADPAPGPGEEASLPEVPEKKKRDWLVALIAVVPLLSCFSGLPLVVGGYSELARVLHEDVAFPILGLSLIAGLACAVAVGLGRGKQLSWLALLSAGSPWLLGALMPVRGDRRLAALHLGFFLSTVLFAYLALAYGFLARRAKAEGRRGAAALLGVTAVIPTIVYLLSRAGNNDVRELGLWGLGAVLALGAALSASALGEDPEEKAAEHSLAGLLSVLLALLGLAEAVRIGVLYEAGVAARSDLPEVVMELLHQGARLAGHHTWIPMAVLAPLGALVLLVPKLEKARRAVFASVAVALLLIGVAYLTHPSLRRFAPGVHDPRVPEGASAPR